MKNMKELFDLKSQDQIAKETGLTQPGVSRAYREGAGAKVAKAIHRVYGIPYSDIFAWPPQEPDQAA